MPGVPRGISRSRFSSSVKHLKIFCSLRIPLGFFGFLRVLQGSLGFLRVPQGSLGFPQGSLGFGLLGATQGYLGFLVAQNCLGFLMVPQGFFGSLGLFRTQPFPAYQTEGSSVLFTWITVSAPIEATFKLNAIRHILATQQSFLDVFQLRVEYFWIENCQ